MKLKELVTEVEITVEDPNSYDSKDIAKAINSAIVEAAGMINIPQLKRIGTLSSQAGVGWVNMAGVSSTGALANSFAETFSGLVRRVRVVDTEVIPKVYPDLERLQDDYPSDDEGDIVAVAQEGSILWYKNIPSASVTLSLVYFVNPPLLVRDDDVPTIFPEHVHRKLLIHGAAWWIWSEKEDRSELEGKKEKTAEHFWHSFDERNPKSGINMYREWLARTRPHHISSVWSV